MSIPAAAITFFIHRDIVDVTGLCGLVMPIKRTFCSGVGFINSLVCFSYSVMVTTGHIF